MKKYFTSQNVFWTGLLVTVAIISTWLLIEIQSAPRHKLLTKRNIPNAVMINTHSWQMNKDGSLKMQLISPKLIHLPRLSTTLMQTPHFILYDAGKKPWNVWARHGKAIHGMKILYLWDNVRFHQQAGPNNHATMLFTSAITVFPFKHFAQTDRPVIIKQPGDIVDAVGMRVDTDQGWVKLLKDVKVEYNPQQSQGAKQDQKN